MIHIGNRIVKQIDQWQENRPKDRNKLCYKWLGKGHRILAIFVILVFILIVGGVILASNYEIIHHFEL